MSTRVAMDGSINSDVEVHFDAHHTKAMIKQAMIKQAREISNYIDNLRAKEQELIEATSNTNPGYWSDGWDEVIAEMQLPAVQERINHLQDVLHVTNDAVHTFFTALQQALNSDEVYIAARPTRGIAAPTG